MSPGKVIEAVITRVELLSRDTLQRGGVFGGHRRVQQFQERVVVSARGIAGKAWIGGVQRQVERFSQMCEHRIIAGGNHKKAVRRAFQAQQAGLGLAVVELLSNCPTNWGCTPAESLACVESHMLPYFPLGIVVVACACAAPPDGHAPGGRLAN